MKIPKIGNYSQVSKVFIFVLFIILEFVMVLSLVQIRYCGVILFWFAVAGLIGISIKEKKEKNKTKKGNLLIQMILNLKGEAGSWVGIVTVIFIVINLNIISNLIWETKNSLTSIHFIGYLTHVFNGQIDFLMLNNWGIFITQILLIICFLILPFYIFPIIDPRVNNYPKVLISGLSLLTDFGKNPANKEEVKKKLLSIDSESTFDEHFHQTDPKISTPKDFEKFNFNPQSIYWGKWNVIRHSIVKHTQIEKIILITSSEIHQLITTINQLIEEDKTGYFGNFDMEKLIQKYYPDRNIEVIYSTAMDFNDFYNIKSRLQSTIEDHALGKGFSDADLLFNITGGTAQLTAAMILSALKGDRKAEYISQNTSEVVSVDVDVLTIQDLWDEIALRVMKNKL